MDLEALLRELDEKVRNRPLVDAGESSEDAGEKFLLVHDGPGTIGFRLEQVAGVVARPRCGRPPRAPKWLLGVFFWEGKMVPLLDWAVLSTEASATENEEMVTGEAPGRAVVLRLEELLFAVAVKDIVGVRRLRLVDGGVEASDEPEADTLGSRFSSVLRWQPEGLDPGHGESSADGGKEPTEVRVVSAMGLLAHRSIARFANPGLIESLFVLRSQEAEVPEPSSSGVDP